MLNAVPPMQPHVIPSQRGESLSKSPPHTPSRSLSRLSSRLCLRSVAPASHPFSIMPGATSDLVGRIEYSEKYQDDKHDYRHVILPKELAKQLPKGRLLSENEWRGIGVQQSRGWGHYAMHRPEPHILLFRRPLGTDPVSGKVDPELEKDAKENYQQTLHANLA